MGADDDDDDAPGGPLIARQSAGVDAEHEGRKTDGSEPTEQQAERRDGRGEGGHRWSCERFLRLRNNNTHFYTQYKLLYTHTDVSLPPPIIHPSTAALPQQSVPPAHHRLISCIVSAPLVTLRGFSLHAASQKRLFFFF